MTVYDVVVETRLPADDGRVAAELGLPEPVAEDHRRRRAGAIVVARESRPNSGATPSVGSRSALTAAPSTRCGSPGADQLDAGRRGTSPSTRTTVAAAFQSR